MENHVEFHESGEKYLARDIYSIQNRDISELLIGKGSIWSPLSRVFFRWTRDTVWRVLGKSYWPSSPQRFCPLVLTIAAREPTFPFTQERERERENLSRQLASSLEFTSTLSILPPLFLFTEKHYCLPYAYSKFIPSRFVSQCVKMFLLFFFLIFFFFCQVIPRGASSIIYRNFNRFN